MKMWGGGGGGGETTEKKLSGIAIQKSNSNITAR